MSSLRSRRAGDRGAILILIAAGMVLLLVLVAFAVDLGKARWSNRDNQQTVDLASLAAGFYLSGHGSSGDPQNEPRAACEAAFASVQTNAEEFNPSVSAQAACSGFPETNVACNDTTPKLTTGPITGGPFTLTIDWPVPDGDITDSRFDGGVGVNDGDQCNRMGIYLEKVDETSFGRIAGVDTIHSDSNAVVSGSPGLNTLGVAALLLLERESCEALQTSGQGRVIVKTVTDPATGDQRPGVIQADSAGSTSFPSSLQCTTNNNPRGYVIYGTELPGNGGPSIIAEDAPNGDLGIIATYAETVGGRAACCRPDGLSVEPTGSDYTSRAPADDRFNPTTRPAIGDLHAAAWSATVTDGATITGTPVTDCQPPDGAVFSPVAPETTITVVCPATGFSVQNNRSVTFEGAATVKFVGGISVSGDLEVRDAATVTISRPTLLGSGQLAVGNNGVVSFNSVRNVYVGGTHLSGTAVSVSGTLRVNTGAIGTSGCADGPGATPPGPANNWAALATVGGNVAVSGSVSWCQTSVYVGTSTATYAKAQRASGGLNCATNKPCPVLTTSDSRDRFSLSGGNSSIIWSAPNQTATPPDVADPFEGLALWVEGTGTSEIKGTGALSTTGIFFAPNAVFEFDGQAAANNPFNAQFFMRTLNFSGQGDLNLSPNPRDSIPTPIPGTYAIIR